MSDIPKFKVGDLVTRDGSDVQRVTYVSEDFMLIDTICVEPGDQGWCKVGDTENNISWRYEKV